MTTERTRGILDNVNIADLPAVHIHPGEVDSLIVQHGTSGEYRRHVRCPCVRIDSRTPDVSCPHCRGIGSLYPEALRSPLIVLDVQRTATLRLIAAGQMATGTVQLTFPSDVVPAIGDQWHPDGEEHVVHEVLYRSGSNRVTDAELRPYRAHPDHVKQALGTRRERLLYPSVCCVESVAYIDEQGQMVHAQPSEYAIGPDGEWTWRVGGPAPGRAWSVRYRAPAVYMVHTSAPVYRTEADQQLPQRVIAQRLDRVASEDLR